MCDLKHPKHAAEPGNGPLIMPEEGLDLLQNYLAKLTYSLLRSK